MGDIKYPFITVGLSFYNSEKTLSNAIKSVLLQTYTNFEFVIIDDGSSDGSYNIAERLSKSDSRIKLIRGEKNIGLAFRLNQITDLAGGEYIARMDSDDIMLPWKIEKQMSVLMENQHIDLIDCLVYIIDTNDNPVGKWKSNDLSNLSLRKILKQKTGFYHATVIAKTCWFKQNRYNADFKRGQDFELWCRTFGQTAYTRLEEYLYLYREVNLSIKKYKSSRQSLRKTLMLYYKGNISSAELKKEIFLSYVQVFLYNCMCIFHLRYFLSAKRNMPLDSNETACINKHIKGIKEFKHQQLQ
jgi:glycosyltransferase involved in cell wall biosynthesis